MGLGILAVVFSGPITVLFLIAWVKRLVPTLRASRDGAVAQGKVLSVKSRSGGAPGFPSARREAHIQFTTVGGERTTYIQVLEPGVECHTGKAVNVHYLSARPSESATIKNPYDVATTLWVMGGVTVLFGFVLVYGVLLILGVVSDSGTSASVYSG